MAKKSNRTLIGIFVVGAVALVVGAVVIFGSGRFLRQLPKFVMFFEGSVKGLDVGAPVVFRGVKVGSVIEMELRADPETFAIWIPVVVEIHRERFKLDPAKVQRAGFERDARKNLPRLIEHGLRAQLQTESLVTGKLLIELDFHPDKPAKFMETDITYPQIPTIPSTMQELTATIKELPLKELVSKIAQTVDGINDVVQSADLSASAANLNHLMEDARKLLQDVDEKVEPLATRLDETLGDYGKLARGMDAKVEPLGDTAKVTLENYGKLARDLDARIATLTENIDKTLAAAEGVLQEGRKALADADQFIAQDSPLYQELVRTMREFSSTARSIRALTDYLKRHPEALIRGKGGTGAK